MNNRLREAHQKFFKGKSLTSAIVIVSLTLIFLFLTSNLIPTGSDNEPDNFFIESPKPNYNDQVISQVSVSREHANNLEKRLSEAFTNVAGVGETIVMVTLTGTVKQVVAQNSILNESSTVETTEAGGTREIISRSQNLTYVYNSGGPLLLTTNYPSVEGVIIVAQGANEPHIVESLINATRAVLGIEANRISVLPMSN